MSTADLFDVELFDSPEVAADSIPLPVSVSPCADEALASWLLRYATPLAIPPEILLLDRADAELIDRADWWRRPDPRLLVRLAARTGVTTSVLAAMTFLDCCPPGWRDEMSDHFARWRFHRPPTVSRCLRRFAICPQCLAEDATPYVRKTWTVGWASICADHSLVLALKCPQCHRAMQLPLLSADTHFTPERCKRCGFHLSTAPQLPAHPLAVRLQNLLLAHRAGSAVPLPEVGTLEWPVAVAFFDVLLGMVWNGPQNRFRNQLLARLRRDLDLAEEFGDGHYEGLLLLAWLLDQWPQHLRIAMATLKVPRPRRQIDRWHGFDPELKRSVETIFIPAWPDESHAPGRAWWRGWIDTLPQTGDQLRALAAKARFPSRRMRLSALADVRDGIPVERAAKEAGVLPKTLYRWLKRGAEGGLEAALDRPYGKLSPAQALEIADWIAAASPDEPRWRFNRVQNEVLRRFGLEIGGYVAARLLRAHGPWRPRRQVPIRRSTLRALPLSRD
jgi:transposase